MKKLLALAIIVVFIMAASPCLGGIPHLINYQGMLTDDLGEALNGSFDLTFRIFDDSTGGTQEWGETQYGIMVTDGLFSVNVGDSTPVDLPFDEDYWLEIEVGVYGPLSPRTRIVSVGYAYRAERVDTSVYSFQAQRADTADYAISSTPGGSAGGDLTGTYPDPTIATDAVTSGKILDGTIGRADVQSAFKAPYADTADYALAGAADQDWTFRITDTADTTLVTGGPWGISRSGNVLYGNADSTHVNLGAACTTGTSGQNYKYCTVGGGYTNAASGDYATVGGGWQNTASEVVTTVGGGAGNTASDEVATVGGGSSNTASHAYATIGGGDGNTASGQAVTIGGGSYNSASSQYATIGGGYTNTASGYYATVAGGETDTASGNYATVGGGVRNTASGVDATVGGGDNNTASYVGATVGGGEDNTASQEDATIGGGIYNTASGRWSTVPGGSNNTGGGDNSFAAGRRAKANHNGTFVWADNTDADFASTGEKQFLIRASGGVGIGTSSPQGALDVNSTTGAFIVPRMTTAQRDALTAVNGMIIYNTTINQFNFYENGAWVTK